MRNTLINASSENISERVGRAMEELAEKAAMQRRAKELRQKENEARAAQREVDEELEAIRRERVERMRSEVKERDKVAHGELTTITQDEFLDTVLKSARVVCHFFHGGFETCAVMDNLLRAICVKHPETRFVRIDAEKAPFFVDKLAVRTLPTLACFLDGKLINKQIGFQGIAKAEEACTASDMEKVLVRMTMIQGDREGEHDEEEEEEEERRTTSRFVGRETKDDDDW